MKNLKYILMTVFCVSIALFPGDLAGQSIFGLNFIGEHNLGGNSRYSATGYSGIAFPDTNSALTLNTATLSDLSSVTFSIFEMFNLSRVNTELETSDQNRFVLPFASVAVPVKDGLVLGVGYRTRFFGRGNFSQESDVDFTPRPMELYEFNSSLYTVPFSLAWRPLDWLRLGGEVQIDRGSIKDEVYVYFPDEPLYSSMSSIRTRGFSGTSWSLSALVKLHPRVWVGASFDDKVDYSVEEVIQYSLSRLDTVSTYDFTLPSAWSAGVAVAVTDRWWVSSSYWTREAPEPSGFEHLEGSLSDESVISFGIERRAGSDGGKLSGMPLRFGYYENRWHLEFPAGQQVVSRFFTLGSGFGMPGGPGGIDFTVEVGKIGSVADNGIDEKVLRLGLSMSLSEKWSRRKEDRH
ncbi:MAG: hypothetical protein KAV42_07845 [Candidatus Krumholzibacteria bacterium]|nr:hypothetical protein [Candidatus Krumholzibacteria bacterium]